MDTDQLFAQGARCGHVEGKQRVGQYVLDEEFEPSFEAACINTTNSVDQSAWASGYRHGYKLSAEGSPLEAELQDGRR